MFGRYDKKYFYLYVESIHTLHTKAPTVVGNQGFNAHDLSAFTEIAIVQTNNTAKNNVIINHCSTVFIFILNSTAFYSYNPECSGPVKALGTFYTLFEERSGSTVLYSRTHR